MANERLADLIYNTTRKMTQTELNRFRKELTKALPVVVEKAATKARAQTKKASGDNKK